MLEDDENIHNIPLIKQDPWSLDCGLCCMAMVADMSGLDILELLKQENHVYPDIWMFTPQLGCILSDYWIPNKRHTGNPLLFPKSMRWKNKDEVLKYLDNFSKLNLSSRNEFYPQVFERTDKYLWEKNWEIIVDVCKIQTIKDILDAWWLCIASVITWFLSLTDRAAINFHFVVFVWCTDEHIIVHDPIFDEPQKRTYEETMLAILSTAYGSPDNASFLAVFQK